MAWALHLLGLAVPIAGEYPAALAHHEQPLAIWQDLGHVEGIGACFNAMGFTACRQGNCATALAHARDGVRALGEVGSDRPARNAVAPFAAVAAVLGQPRRAARLAGAVQADGESAGISLVSSIQEQLDPALVDRPGEFRP